MAISKHVPLTQGLFALVDAEDYERVMRHKWFAVKKPIGKKVLYYACTQLRISPSKQKMLPLHHLVFGAPPKGMDVDHRNGDTLNCCKYNLRYATRAQNAMNSAPNVGRCFKGTSYHKRLKKWQASIRVDGKLKFLGYHQNETGAARAYNTAARQFFGSFARLNTINGRAL